MPERSQAAVAAVPAAAALVTAGDILQKQLQADRDCPLSHHKKRIHELAQHPYYRPLHHKNINTPVQCHPWRRQPHRTRTFDHDRL